MVDVLSFVNDGSVNYVIQKTYSSSKILKRLFVHSSEQCSAYGDYRFFFDNSFFFDLRTQIGAIDSEIFQNANFKFQTIKIIVNLTGLTVLGAVFTCVIEYEDV